MYDSNPQNVVDFVNNQFKDYNILFGYDDQEDPYYTKLGGLKAWPLTVIVDSEGIIAKVTHGSMSESELRSEIEKLQLERLQETVSRVYEKVAPYREKMDKAGVKPEDIKTLKDFVLFIL